MALEENISEFKNIYFIGIGGISMSGLAEILHNNNHIVRGSDSTETDITKHLCEQGIKIAIGHKYENIPMDMDLVVYTAAVKQDNPEIVSAKDKNIKVIDRAYLLAMMMKDYKYPICVSGTHGKTTTTSMLSEVLLEAGRNPTVMLGGVLNSIGKSYRIGGNEFFTIESCEYYDSFLRFYPHTGIVLNIDLDHVDYFKDLFHIQDSFNKFCKNIDKDGNLIINNNIENLDKIIKGANCKVITYGNTEADYYAENIVFDEDDLPKFDVIQRGKKICSVSLGVRGMHNIENSLAVFIACKNFGIGIQDITKGLYKFKGANRRFQQKGIFNGIKIVDDYAHHPTEIVATLKTAKTLKNINKTFVVFQPHTYSRTQRLLNEFSKAFYLADEIIILDIYSAREKDENKVHSRDLVDKIKENGKNAKYCCSFDDAQQYILDNCINNDLLITMGAGDVYLIGESILNSN